MRLFDLFEQPGKTAVIGWGRFNPPTIGHQKLVDVINKTASKEKGDAMLFLTKSHDPLTTPTGKPTTKEIKNPLTFDQKLPFAQKFFNINVDTDPNLKTIMSVMAHLQNQGYERVIVVAGSDRVPEYETLLKQYNGVPDKAGNVNFSISDVQVVNAGMRDPDADGVEGMSASKLRQFAKDGDFDNFAKGVPSDEGTAKALYDLIRKNLGIKETEPAEGIAEANYGRYWCSTDKKWKQRKGPKQKRSVAEGISVVDQDYDLDQVILTLDIEGKRASFTYTDYDENFENAERKDVFDQLQNNSWYKGLDHPTKMEILDAAYKAIRGEEPSEYKPTVGDEPMDDGDLLDATDPTKIKVPAVKPRDPNWRDMEALRKSGAGGVHKDKRKVIPRKQKYKDVAEGYQDFEVMGHKYMPDLDIEDDNRKIWHTIITSDGKTIDADFTPYSYMDKDDLKLFIKLGYPKRQGAGPLNKDELQQMARMAGIAKLDPEMANAGKSMGERYRDPEDWDEGNTEPPNNFVVYIDGRKWKVFKGNGQYADDMKEKNHFRQLKAWAAKKSAATGKKWEVYITGENPTA